MKKVLREEFGGSSHASGNSSEPYVDQNYLQIIRGLQDIYNKKIKPLEVAYNFEGFHSAPLTNQDIAAKPIVLLIGQYSTGKTTFIRYLLEEPYPGEHIGVEPTVSQSPSPVLENMTIIDTPGILAGDKQRIERGYDFTAVTEWFAERADLVLLLFDSHKLDISNEFKMAIHGLRGKEEKVRCVLNKSDMVSPQELMRVYGAMMWSLGKVVQTPEVMRVYLGSFWIEKPVNSFDDQRALLEAEQRDLLRDMSDLPRNAAIRKINEIVKRARLAKVHALIIGHLKKEMPNMFGKKKKQANLLANLDKVFLKIQRINHLPPGDFPNAERFRQNLENYDIDKFKNLRPELLARVDEALSVDLPRLMSRFPQGNRTLAQAERNPFAVQEEMQADGVVPQSYWDFQAIDKGALIPRFNALEPVQGKVPGAKIKPVLMESGLPNDVLAHVWRLSDWDNDGYMDSDEFAVAMHLTKIVQNGGTLPETLPDSLRPHRRI
ncbi:hypothetical protein BZG36_00069 [Bifiguratus adelaidae]|uniref:EH domain-containing protein 1 n=1 Tax=Bifiguratus adelaidae TaxID=1938954 RepID=A0A261Y881_9FUNG|nr:hypothetical protein BZG36_00069 [Bifiguratus adelaidae]